MNLTALSKHALCMVLVTTLPGFYLHAQLVQKSLVVDLNADSGVFVTDAGRVYRWENKATGTKAKFFDKRDEGRAIAGSGCPGYRRNIPEINGHDALVFHEQELLNDSEDAFDHLLTGTGYTFFCVIRPFTQTGKLKDVNSFFGNLRNGGMFEGLWGGFTDDNRVWAGARNGLTFGRWDANNPFICTSDTLSVDDYHLVMGRMDAGDDSAALYLMVNKWDTVTHTQKIKVNLLADASKLSIGQERDAIQHPGVESFDGEIARFLLYERPLDRREMESSIEWLCKYYNVRRK